MDDVTVRVGAELLHDPLRNRGTAFTEPQRDHLGLDRAAAAARGDARTAGGPRPRERARQGERDREIRLPVGDPERERDPLLPRRHGQPAGAPAGRLHADRRPGLPGVEPALLPAARPLSHAATPRQHRATSSALAAARHRHHRRHRRRSHPRPRRPRRQRHGHSHRQARALHGLRGRAALALPADHPRCRHRYRRAPRRPVLPRATPCRGSPATPTMRSSTSS